MIEGRELSDKKFQIDSLDGLRGLAVLLVILSHTSGGKSFLFPHMDFSGAGKNGVFLFFVLSSFLLTLPFIKKQGEAKSFNFLLNYFSRRFFRIYPLYFIYLLLALATSKLAAIVHYGESKGIPFYLTFKDFIEHLFLIQGKEVTWSIVVEFHYYFVLPFVALAYSVVFKNKLIPSILFTLGLIVLSQVFWPQHDAVPNDLRLGPYLLIFFMGSLLALLFHKWQEHPLSKNNKVILAIEITGILALLVLIFLIPSVSSFFLEKKIPFNQYHEEFIIFGLLWSIVLFSSITTRGVIRRFFEYPFLRYLGFISFSAYLLHEIAMSLISKVGVNHLMQGWFTLALTILLSHISWTLIEKPAAKIKIAFNLKRN